MIPHQIDFPFSTSVSCNFCSPIGDQNNHKEDSERALCFANIFHAMIHSLWQIQSKKIILLSLGAVSVNGIFIRLVIIFFLVCDNLKLPFSPVVPCVYVVKCLKKIYNEVYSV